MTARARSTDFEKKRGEKIQSSARAIYHLVANDERALFSPIPLQPRSYAYAVSWDVNNILYAWHVRGWLTRITWLACPKYYCLSQKWQIMTLCVILIFIMGNCTFRTRKNVSASRPLLVVFVSITGWRKQTGKYSKELPDAFEYWILVETSQIRVRGWGFHMLLMNECECECEKRERTWKSPLLPNAASAAWSNFIFHGK